MVATSEKDKATPAAGGRKTPVRASGKAPASATGKTPARRPAKSSTAAGREERREEQWPTRRDKKGKAAGSKGQRPNGELAMQRALAELDFAPGELADDQYEVTIVIPPEEGFMGVGAVDAVVEVALVGEEFDFYGPEDDTQPAELLKDDVDDDE